MVVGPRNQGVTSATYAGLFLVTAATLMLEIGLTRIFSVMMWYHFAFVAISVALFGMTVGALIVHLLPHRFPQERVHHQLWRLALLLGVSIAVSFAVQLRIRFIPRFNLDGIVSVVLTCAVVAVPFIISGVIVCLALTGSMASERVLRRGGRPAHLGPLAALLVAIVAFGLLTPAATSAADGATTPARIALAVVLLAPLALLMGMPFAVGMHAAAGRPGTPTAFLWGINGATSVCGSVLGVVIALFLGVSMAFWAGALAYVVSLLSMVVITRRSAAAAEGDEEAVIDLREQAMSPPAVVAPTG